MTLAHNAGLANVVVVYDSDVACEDEEVTRAKHEAQRAIFLISQNLELLNSVSRRPNRPATFDRSNPSREALTWVAYVYRRAVALRKPPKQAVATDLGVSRATAGRWIAAARARQHLPRRPSTTGGDR